MSSFASKLIAASHRPERWARRLLRWLLTALALLWLLLLALWLLLHFVILPSADRWRPDLEAAASRALGVSVRIARLEVRTRGWMPTLEASDLELVDAQGHKALQLQRVTATLSARSFLAWPPRLEQLAVHAPELTVRRDTRGQIWVAGLALQPDAVSGDPRLLDWLLRQRELALEDGRLLWIDELKGAAPLPLSAVRGVWRNGLRRHEGRIDVTPPPELGERLSLRARFTQPLFERPSDWRRWSGLAYAELPGARLEALHERLALPFELRQGGGALRLWAELERGHVREVQIDLGIEQARLRLTPQVDPLELQSLHARLVWQRLNEGSRWALRGLRFALPADEPGAVSNWPLSNATLTLRHAAVAAPWQLPAEGLMGGELQADRLDLALLARLAGALPLEPRLRQLLGEREPQGRLEQLQARWQGPLAAPTQWRLSAQATDLALLPGALPEATPELPHPLAQPGLAGAALRFEADQDGGEAQLRLGGSGGEGELRWPGLLEADRLALRAADLPLRWRRDSEGGGEGDATGWRVEWSGSQLESADAVLRADGHWRSGGRPGGLIDLTVRAPQAALLAVPRHLPQVLPLTVRQYLGDALQGGQLRDIRMELKGALADFPFRQGQGRFAVSARVQDGRYAYLPSHGADATRAAHQSPWPGFEALQGEIRFDNAGMRLRIERGRSAGLDIEGVEVRIPDLGQAPRVLVKGRWAGDAAQALAFVRATPIHGWTQQAFGQAQALGPATIGGELQLSIPIEHARDATVQGTVQLPAQGLGLRLRDDLPTFTQLRGSASFSEQGLQLRGLQGRFLGGELRVGGGTRPEDGTLYIEASGQASSEGLRAAAREWPALGLLAPRLAGQADYRLRLAFKGAQPELELRSTLQGMVSNWPAPLAKAGGEALPLLLRVQPQEGSREVWGLSLGEGSAQVLEALLERDGLRTRRGAIRIGSAGVLPLPDSGVKLLWAAPQIDLDPWRALLGGEPLAADAWLPDLIELQTPLLRVAQRRLTGLQAGLRLAANRHDWRVQLRAEQLAGEAEWRQPPGQPPQLMARLQRLALPESESQRVEQYLDQAQGALPMLDVQVEDFELRGRKLGRLLLRADGAAAGRDWTLQQLSIEHPQASLTAKGQWRAAEKRSQLEWQLAIADSGRWLDALGFANVLRGGKGELRGVLGWAGSPLSPSSAGLDGQFSIALDKGQFLKADPGVARLLGILSLQSLARRLLFDWRDVFASGFAFDELAGEVQIRAGVAQTRNLRMLGLQANVLMEGGADLGAETTELRVLVVPNLDAGGASLAYTAVNPAVGLTAFLAQWLLKKPIQAASTTELRVHGPWSDPVVERVERAERAAAPLPPGSAASAR